MLFTFLLWIHPQLVLVFPCWVGIINPVCSLLRVAFFFLDWDFRKQISCFHWPWEICHVSCFKQVVVEAKLLEYNWGHGRNSGHWWGSLLILSSFYVKIGTGRSMEAASSWRHPQEMLWHCPDWWLFSSLMTSPPSCSLKRAVPLIRQELLLFSHFKSHSTILWPHGL